MQRFNPLSQPRKAPTVRTTRILSTALLALASTGAFATTCKNGGTNWPTCTPPVTHPGPPSTLNVSPSSSSTSTSSAGSTSSARADSSASLSGTLTATGGAAGAGGSASFEDWSRQNMYVLPAPVQAAPLPPGLCPQGDSMSIGILWNLFSYARSSTRSEMECLDKVLAAIKPAQVVQVVQAPVLPVSPAAVASAPTTSAVPASGATDASQPVKKQEAAKVPAKKASAPKKAASSKPSTPTCEETALQSCKPAKRT